MDFTINKANILISAMKIWLFSYTCFRLFLYLERQHKRINYFLSHVQRNADVRNNNDVDFQSLPEMNLISHFRNSKIDAREWCACARLPSLFEGRVTSHYIMAAMGEADQNKDGCL
jgi:hypothetical protein